MVDVDRVDMDDIKPKKDSPVSMIRTACYAKDVDKAIHMANCFVDKGYEATVNLMAVSKVLEVELMECFEQLEKECKVIYLVDSNGALYQERSVLGQKPREHHPSIGVPRITQSAVGLWQYH